MKIFEKFLTVVKDDLDELDHVNNVRYVQWVQDIAKEHWFLNSTKTLNKDYFWVLLSHHIEYKSSAVLGDIIKLKTYVKNFEGVKSIRMVEMFHSETNKLIVKSQTIWCLIDRKTLRPTRVTDEIGQLFN